MMIAWDTLILLAVAGVGLWRVHVERREDRENEAAERARRRYGSVTPYWARRYK